MKSTGPHWQTRAIAAEAELARIRVLHVDALLAMTERLTEAEAERDRYRAALQQLATLGRAAAESDPLNSVLWAGEVARKALGLAEAGDGDDAG